MNMTRWTTLAISPALPSHCTALDSALVSQSAGLSSGTACTSERQGVALSVFAFCLAASCAVARASVWITRICLLASDMLPSALTQQPHSQSDLAHRIAARKDLNTAVGPWTADHGSMDRSNQGLA